MVPILVPCLYPTLIQDYHLVIPLATDGAAVILSYVSLIGKEDGSRDHRKKCNRLVYPSLEGSVRSKIIEAACSPRTPE